MTGVPCDETGTDPDISDDAIAPGEDMPNLPSDEQVGVAIEAFDRPIARRERQA